MGILEIGIKIKKNKNDKDTPRIPLQKGEFLFYFYIFSPFNFKEDTKQLFCCMSYCILCSFLSKKYLLKEPVFMLMTSNLFNYNFFSDKKCLYAIKI